MNKVRSFIAAAICPLCMWSQNDIKKEKPPQEIAVTSFAYANTAFVSEQHSNFVMNKPLGKGLSFQLAGQYDTYLTSNIFKTNMTFKKYFGRKLYLFSGYELEMEQVKSNPNTGLFEFINTFRGKYTNGVGYDNEKKNLNIEFKHDLNFSKNNLGSFGTPSMLTLKGVYKF
ncbi:hypothetical protein [Spongiivirga citrea]|uniref:DUF3575 domain-containing protein n=1 Tax=Spongiivirga citrea TaxID=1481457 RepID=A0A6M0CMG0_9FLAO|nr:hypothetical protein [Spongiivirga citrea]NER16637.1 hypothetical protein [Spongiivirga citrea]